MTVGTGIFLASLVLGVIALFAITKDRWNWAKIIRSLAIASVGLIAIAVGGFYGWNAVKEANEATRVKLAQQQEATRVKLAEQQEANEAAREKLARQQEARARMCIAGDLPRLENLARSIQGAVRGDMKLEDVKTVTDKLTGYDGQIVPPQNDIKERVLIYKLSTHCDSTFNLLVNVRANDQGALKSLHVWAKNSPIGYAEGLHSEFSTEFEQDRARKALLAQKSEMNALEAKRLPSEKQHRDLENQERDDTDPCAPHLANDERVKRLAAFGKVRQTGEGEYSAGGHRVVFILGSLYSCE